MTAPVAATGTVSGSTTVAAVIGSPVRHSLSPALHNAAFAAAGADWVYTAFEVAPGRADKALDAMRTLGLGGLSVTMPHKEQVAGCVDELDPAASALGSVNTVVPIGDDRLRGHSTDGPGFVASLHAAGVDPTGMKVVVIGAGAASRSVIDALTRADVVEIVVVNRSPEAALRAAALAHERGRVGHADEIPAADLVVQATSVGMGTSATPVDPGLLRHHHVVADLVYHPIETALLAAARAAGAVCVDGLGMLVHQAALQQELWLGHRPDVDAMRAAAERELASRV